MNDLFPLVVGITSSLIATILFISTSEILRRTALPWYADKIYRGVRIDGKWESTHISDEPEGSNRKFTFNLKQNGDVVSGEFSILCNKSQTEDHYTIIGNIRDAAFCATMRSKSQHYLDAAACVLRICCPLSKLEMSGVITAIVHNDNTVESSNISFKRIGS